MNQDLQEIISVNSQPLEFIPAGVEPKLKFIPNIKAILFDIYGTLFVSGSGDIGVHSSMAKSEFLKMAAESCGLDLQGKSNELLQSLHETIERSHGRSKELGIEFPEVNIVEIWKEVLAGHPLSVEQLQSFSVQYETRSNPVWPMPHLKETLISLNQRFRLGLISNAQFFTLELFPALLQKTREQLGFQKSLEFFSFQSGSAKPGLELYQQAAKRLQEDEISPEQVLYVGNDMLNDIMPASKMGFQTVLFAGDQRSLRWRSGDIRVDGIEPEIIVTDLIQIERCVD